MPSRRLVFLLFALAFLIEVSKASEACNNLNALYEIKLSPFYQQMLTDFQISDDSNLLAVQQFEQKDHNMNTIAAGTQALRLILPDRKTLVLLQQANIDTTGRFKGNTLLGFNQTRIFGMSNVAKVTFSDITSTSRTSTSTISTTTSSSSSTSTTSTTFSHLEEQMRSIVSLIVPSDESSGALARIYFMALNATGEKAVDNVQLTDVIQYSYPFLGKENIFDKEGNVVGTQVTTDPSAVSVHTNGPRSQIQLRVIRPRSHSTLKATERTSGTPATGTVKATGAAEVNHKLGTNDILGTIEFVTLVLTQFSLKLVKYRATVNPFNHKMSALGFPAAATIVMPRVEGTESSNSSLLGGLLHVTEPINESSTIGDIFVVVHVSRDQLKAFKNVHHHIDVDLGQAEEAPFLLKFNSQTFNLEWAVNLASNTQLTTLYATGIDVRGDNIYVGANTLMHQVLSPRDLKNTNDYRSETTKQRAFVIRVQPNNATAENMVASVSEVTNAVITEQDKRMFGANARFVLNDLSSALSGETDKVVVGGTLGDGTTPYAVQARASLVQLMRHGEDAKNLYSLYVGETSSSGSSSAVDIIRRHGNDTTMLLGLMIDGPSTPPPATPLEDKNRGVKTGFYQIDCSPLNTRLEQAMKIAFFVFSAITMLVFASVVVFHGTTSVLMFIRSKREDQ